MSVRTPNEAYLKSRRALVVASGLLALSVFSGIVPEGTDGSVTIFSFHLKSPENIPLVFLVITSYLIWQLWSAWLVQDNEVRGSLVNKIDVFLSFFIATGAITSYFWPKITGFLSRLDLDFSPIVSGTTGILLGILTSTLASSLLVKIASKLKALIKIKEIKAEKDLRSELTTGDWLLIFNPKNSLRGKKVISFNSDGSVGKGMNANESTWKLRDQILEIINSEGRVFSRFHFDMETNRFDHTNESDTLSIKSQSIIREPA